MSEILPDYEFGNVLGRIPVCEASTEAERILRAHDAALRARLDRLDAALRPFVDPESYSTTEEECRLNPAMDWCAVHSFRWPCPVKAARAVLAGQGVGRG